MLEMMYAMVGHPKNKALLTARSPVLNVERCGRRS